MTTAFYLFCNPLCNSLHVLLLHVLNEGLLAVLCCMHPSLCTTVTSDLDRLIRYVSDELHYSRGSSHLHHLTRLSHASWPGLRVGTGLVSLRDVQPGNQSFPPSCIFNCVTASLRHCVLVVAGHSLGVSRVPRHRQHRNG